MKTRTFFFPVACLVAFIITSLASCSQEPIFFAIEREVALKESSVEGIISSMVRTSTTVYAANGHLYARPITSSVWTQISKPSGAFRINEVASDGTTIYALAADESWATTGVYRFNEGTRSWQALTGPENIQKISSGDDRIYAIAGPSTGPFAVFVTASPTATSFESTPRIVNVGQFLTGATTAGEYIASRSAIHYFDGISVTRITGADVPQTGPSPGPTSDIIGITETDDGNLYAVTSLSIFRYTDLAGWSVLAHNGGSPTTLAHMQTSDRRLLLVGTTEGYFEVLLNADGTLLRTFKPGEDALSSTAPSAQSQYKSSIGLWNINHILTVSNPLQPQYRILASVANRRYGGAWSYISPDRTQWNRE